VLSCVCFLFFFLRKAEVKRRHHFSSLGSRSQAFQLSSLPLVICALTSRVAAFSEPQFRTRLLLPRFTSRVPTSSSRFNHPRTGGLSSRKSCVHPAGSKGRGMNLEYSSLLPQGQVKEFVGPRHVSSPGPFGGSKSTVGTTVYSRLSGLMKGYGMHG
jgi:hypothetical protein